MILGLCLGPQNYKSTGFWKLYKDWIIYNYTCTTYKSLVSMSDLKVDICSSRNRDSIYNFTNKQWALTKHKWKLCNLFVIWVSTKIWYSPTSNVYGKKDDKPLNFRVVGKKNEINPWICANRVVRVVFIKCFFRCCPFLGPDKRVHFRVNRRWQRPWLSPATSTSQGPWHLQGSILIEWFVCCCPHVPLVIQHCPCFNFTG